MPRATTRPIRWATCRRVTGMPEVDGIEFHFDDTADARAYLDDVARVWAAWIVGLVALLIRSPLYLIAAGIVVITALVFLVRPLQRRAAAIAHEDRGARDRALRALAYGAGPVRQAVALAGSRRWMLVARQVVLAATLGVFLLVLLDAAG